MKIVLTGGCTGGHIYPALAIGDKFKEKQPDCEIIYIAHAYGLETKIVPAAGYELKIITAEWIRRDNPIKMFRTIFGTLKGRTEALRLMKSFKPDVVISTGSFVSVPVVLAAHSYGASIYMHEQNGFPGVANKAFSKFAENIFLGFESARRYFKEKDKVIYSGNPVRRDFYGRDKIEDRARLEIPEADFVITVFGGSLGSDATNDIAEGIIRSYGNRKGYTIVFGTGRDYYDEVERKLRAQGLGDLENVKMSPYIAEMPSVISASDLVISRAGALSVAEVTMAGRAAIFVPSPNVTADHQYYNARSVADMGGAIIVRESENTAEEVLQQVERLDSDRTLVRSMEKASFALAPTEAADIIYNKVMEKFR